MRTKVALVSARPDTIEEDYRRVLDLAGLADWPAEGTPRILVRGAGRSGEPGWDAPLWALDGVLACLGERAARALVATVGEGGLGSLSARGGWRECLDRHRAVPAEGGFARPHRHQSQVLHPALDAILRRDLQLAVGLAGAPAFLLAVPTVRPGWGVAGAASLLRDLVTAGARPGRRAPAAEVTAEAVGVAREHMGELGVVLDGTLWGVAVGAGTRRCVARNVLLAGRDPVAVDAVAARLAGFDPLRLPWLRICQDRGFGQAAPGDINLVGSVGLLEKDFALGGASFDVGRERPLSGFRAACARAADRILGRGAAPAPETSPWTRLAEEYAHGQRQHV